MIPENLAGKALEKFLFDELIKEIIIRKKGDGRKLNRKDLEKLESELGLSRGTIQGAFGVDRTKLKGIPNGFTKNKFAQLDGAYKDFDDFVNQYSARTTVNADRVNSSGAYQRLVKKIRNHYHKQSNFNTISVLGTGDYKDGFNISDFFIDISYVDRAELINNNDFFTIEKEGFSYKRKKKTRSEIFTNYFSVEAVTERLIFKDKQVVLMGNPGVGKSTYARWVCHMWAVGKLALEIVPIYISCRELVSSNINSLAAYINATYFKGQQEEVNKMLSDSDLAYCLILDGYDEASYEQRLLIAHDLNHLLEPGNYPSFALFSRPYALIDSPFRKVSSLFEFIGFNDINLLKYVVSFFEKAGRSNDVEAFLDFVTSSDLLRDLSHNPLNLSYIASIYCSKNGEATLKTIQSTYDLNKVALKFIVDYHSELKGIERSDFIAKLNECTPFIAELEINLSFVYHQKSPLDDNYRFAQVLSQLGIGRVEENRSNGSWSFYILSVSYQEIIAAEYLGPQLSKSEILALLENPLYWHFTKLLIGYLVSNKKQSVIVEVLDDIYKQTQKRAINYYLYFIVLSELPKDFLNQNLKVRDIASLITLYESLNNDSLWSNLYFECLINIHRKLNEKFKLLFEDIVLTQINSKVTIPKTIGGKGLTIKQIGSIVFPNFLASIIEYLRFFNSAPIAKAILSLYLQLETLNSKHGKWIKNNTNKYGSLQQLASEEIKDSSYLLLILLYQVDDPALLKAHSKQLWTAYNRSEAHCALIIKIIALFTPATYFIDEFDRLAKSKHDFNMLLVNMCVGMAGSFDYNEHAVRIKERLVRMQTLLEKRQGAAARNDEYHRPDFSTYAMSLTLTNEHQLFSLLVWANCFETGALNVMRNFSLREASEILSLFFKSKEQCKYTAVDFEELHATVGSMDTGTLALEENYDNFYGFFEKYVSVHEITLNSISAHKTSDGFLNSPIAYELYTCGNTLYYPSRIKKFLDNIYLSNLMMNKFIRFHYVPFLMSCSVPLYEKKYHDFILNELFSEHEDINVIIHLFSENQVIYWHESNLPFLSNFWTKFILLIKKQQKREFWEGNLPRLLKIAYCSIKLHFQANGQNGSNELVQSVADFMLLPKVKSYILTEDVLYHEETIPNLSIYPLLAFYTGSKSFILSSWFLSFFNKIDEKRKKQFWDELLQLTNFKIDFFNGIVDKKILDLLKVYFGEFNRSQSSEIPTVLQNTLDKSLMSPRNKR